MPVVIHDFEVVTAPAAATPDATAPDSERPESARLTPLDLETVLRHALALQARVRAH